MLSYSRSIYVGSGYDDSVYDDSGYDNYLCLTVAIVHAFVIQTINISNKQVKRALAHVVWNSLFIAGPFFNIYTVTMRGPN